jgi:ATP-dependent DNA ligase
MKQFPTLYHKAKTGKVHEWKVSVKSNVISVEHGQQNGKKQIDKTICEPKNVGKKNATSANEQAEAEAQSMWTYQVERKYVESLQDVDNVVMLPMLAHKFLGEKKISYPVHVQPKLEGVRCLAFHEGFKKSGRIILLSRGGKEYKVPHIQEELMEFLPSDVMLDGEIYAHNQNQQTINSWVKKYKPESKNLFYFVYDVPKFDTFFVAKSKEWKTRFQILTQFFEAFGEDLKYVKQVPTSVAVSKEAVDIFHAQFVADGYEGIIVRKMDGEYEFGHRSHSLLKLKNFQDAEFTVIGAKGGTPGTDEEQCVIWICQLEGAKDEFDVRPRGTHEARKALLKLFKKTPKLFIGKMLTVRFQSYTDAGKPMFPVGIAFRLKEDM